MTLGKFFAKQFLTMRDDIAIAFKAWLGEDAARNYSERKWTAIFRIFKRTKYDN